MSLFCRNIFTNTSSVHKNLTFFSHQRLSYFWRFFSFFFFFRQTARKQYNYIKNISGVKFKFCPFWPSIAPDNAVRIYPLCLGPKYQNEQLLGEGLVKGFEALNLHFVKKVSLQSKAMYKYKLMTFHLLNCNLNLECICHSNTKPLEAAWYSRKPILDARFRNSLFSQVATWVS